MKYVLFLCSLCVFGANAGSVSFIDPCHWKDSECILKSAKKAQPFVVTETGNADLGLPPMNPMVIEEVNCDSGDLKLLFKNLKVFGLDKCNIIKIVRTDQENAHLEVECPITCTGDYTTKGKLAFLDVFGSGTCEISTEKIKLLINFVLKQFTKDDKVFYKIASYDYTFELLKKFDFDFHNLYDGDKEKAAPILEVINTSWKDMIFSIGKPMMDKIILSLIKPIGKMIGKIPVDEFEVA